MASEIVSGLLSIFSVGPLTGILIGIVIGLFFGAVPGIACIMAVAIMLPMTFYVSPLFSIPMLLGVYKAGIFGGSISAILINTPGAPGSVCTTLDGYPLAKEGKGGKALNMALLASVLGDTFSDLVLIFVAAPLSIIALKAGPAERFTLMLFALTIVGSVSGPSLLKGLISCALGLWVATIGFAEVTGSMRFTFGIPSLTAGITFIPMLIGLLALPEVMNQVGIGRKGGRIHLKKSANRDDNRVTWAEFKATLPTIWKSSLIGTFIGAMPGMGSTIATFMAYGEAQRSSKHPERFGKGSLEGIAAAEASNNAVCGATMIPMLTLSIPGDDVTAILMGAFLIQGITPGPTIFYEHTRIIYGIYGGLLLCNLFNFIVARIGFPLWIRLANSPKHLVFSFVTILCFVGSYTFNQSLFDVLTLVIFAIVGYFMRKWQFSPAAFIIGFILGPFMERSLDQAMTLSDGSIMIFFTRPIAALFLLLAIISTVSLVRRRLKTQKR
jgi:putative tricarboxylic transport membrane protein